MKEVQCKTAHPKLSFGLPVRNGGRFIGEALSSLVAQSFPDFEVLISDNLSIDATSEICLSFAEADRRFRYERTETDIGQIENFNRVFRRSRGEYFRWLGADDRLEPGYASSCVRALDENPEAVGVTTLWKLVDDSGQEEFRDYIGPRVDASQPHRRLARYLWFLQAHRLYFDPIYSMLRRESLEQTGLLPIDVWTDRLLATKLCLLGPLCHVHECLATRRDAREPPPTRLARLHPTYAANHSVATNKRLAPLWTMYRGIARVTSQWPMGGAERWRCRSLVLAYWMHAELVKTCRRAKGGLRRLGRVFGVGSGEPK